MAGIARGVMVLTVTLLRVYCQIVAGVWAILSVFNIFEWSGRKG
jgi:hypothetical protein